MKKFSILLATLFLASCGGNVESVRVSETTSADSSSISESTSSETISSGETTSQEISSEESTTISSDTASTSEEVIDELAITDEPYIGRQYYLNHIGDIFSSWQYYRGKGITIAVIDAGFNPYHEEFYYEDGTSKVSELSASFVTDSSTKTYVGIDKVVNMSESHGTFCAGVVGAALNGKGVVGIAPEAKLLLLKTDLKPKSIAAAFKYAADNGAKVVTISIGDYYDYSGELINDGSDLSTVFNEPVEYCVNKGVVVCSAAGNGGGSNYANEYTWPGATPNVIGVGGLAANSSGEIWEGSSYNSSSTYQFVDVFAPSTAMFGCCHYDNKVYDGGWEGTSFASPIVAGMAALYFEKNPNASVAQFTNDLYASCTPLANSSIASEDQLGYGAVNIAKLLDVKTTGTIDIKVKSSWSNVYMYAWDTRRSVELASWPGVKLTSMGNNLFSTTLDLSKFDNLLFTASKDGPQCVDLLASSFLEGRTYNTIISVTENNYIVGGYVK